MSPRSETLEWRCGRGDCRIVGAHHHLPDPGMRGPNEERMVRFGYYAQMAGARWDEGHTAEAAAMLKESNYDVQERLREISAWCYGEGRDIAKAFDNAIRSAEDECSEPGCTLTFSRYSADA